MKLIVLGLTSLLVFSILTPGQTQPQNAMLVKMTASITVQEREISHVVATSSVLVSEKIVTYHFRVRLGGVEYTSEYTPSEREQPGNLPHAWWQGNAPVSIRIAKRKLYLGLPDGREVQSTITGQVPIAKPSWPHEGS